MATHDDTAAAAQDAKAHDSLVQQIAEARRRLSLTLEAAGSTGGWQWHIREQRLVGDASFAVLTGMDAVALASGVPTSAFFGAIHADDVRRIRIAVAGMLAGAEVFSKDFRLNREDGGVRWVHAAGRTLLGDDDEPVLFEGTLVDITDRKRTEDQLRIAQMAGKIGTFEHTKGYGTVSVSHQFCQLLGLHPTTALPVRTINLLVEPEDRPIIDPELPETPQSQGNIEFRINRADTGERRWLARRGEYLDDFEAEGLRYVGVIYDITDAKLVEERLTQANASLSESVRARTRERDQVWQNSRDILAVVADTGLIRDANPAWQAILGHGIDNVADRPFASFFDDSTQADLHALLTRQGERDTIETRMLAADGSERWISWFATREDDLVYLYGRHITAERQQREALVETETQLRQSQKMEAVGQLTGGIAHDFNNMLTGVIGSLDAIKRRIASARYDDLDRFLDAAGASAQRAAALTHRLLAFSRRQSLDRKPTDVAALVTGMYELLQRTLGEQVQLILDLEPQAWQAMTDSNQLENAVLNLAINARDAMPEGGTLSIGLSNRSLSSADIVNIDDAIAGDYVVLTVGDTGEGMARDVIDKAFEPFFTTKPIGQGTGLGLSMIYGFLQQSGGHVRIKSDPGAGTEVSLFLQRSISSALSPEVTSPIDGDLPAGNGQTVLVVEDDPSVRLLVVDLLDDLGYQTIDAADGNAAIPILDSKIRLDLLISDVGLPGVNGRQLADIARATRPDLPVLFITGYAAMATSRQEFLGEGMDMIAKPFDVGTLVAKISAMLDSA
ncbi:MAG: PAS domain S-box protein [Candidatus Devosia phytovorans]|uniref:histidine kinase n=1 Tax=Candidatus Devosia phytovorans TaxID=3121372 RepID=A0AAJ6AZP3_9HYPH|nr:PAS domain S-box protein [Devosia sp.]WEK04357.1 MAG: PAS domain S-box protein [Devosia sp.]